MALKREPDLSVVIVSFNTREFTHQSLVCLRDHAGDVRCEVIVVDENSTDGSARMIEKEFPEVTLLRPATAKGATGGKALGMKHAKGRYILLLEPGIVMAEGVLSETLAYMDANPRAGILGCRLTSSDGTLKPSAGSLPGPINRILQLSGLAARFPSSRIFGKVDYSWWDHSSPRKVGWVAGAFFMIRRGTMKAVGLFDDGYPVGFGEIDYCLSVHRAAYWHVVYHPLVSVVHLGGLPPPRTEEEIARRIAGEFRYHRKCYGPFRLLAIAAVEYLGNAMVRLKHTLFPKNDSPRKKSDAATLMRLITEAFIKTTREEKH